MAISHVFSNAQADATGTVTFWNGATTASAAATNIVRPSDWNSGHNQYYTLSGNTNNASTASGTNVVFQGMGGVTLVGSTGTVGISGYSEPMNYEQLIGTNVRAFAQQSSTSLGQNTVYIQPVILERPLSAICMKLPVLITNSSSAASSGQKGLTFEVGAYSRVATNVTATGYTQLTRIWSTTHTMAASYSSNVSWGQSMITGIGNSTSYNSVTASSAGISLSSSLHGARELIFPVSSSWSAGEYWFGVRQSSSTAGTAGNILNVSNLCATYLTWNRPGVVLNSSLHGFQQELMAGVYSVSSGALPATINQTQIRQAGINVLGFLGQATA